MKLTTQIAKQFREVLLDGNWVAATNYKVQLSDLTWKQATTKIGSLNTIAALTFHINYYLAGVLNVFKNGKLEIRDKYSFDLPPIKSKEDWEKLLNQMWKMLKSLQYYWNNCPTINWMKFLLMKNMGITIET